MTNNNFDAIKDSIMISVLVMPPVDNGKVEFLFPEKIKAINGYISFSAIVSVSQKKEFDGKLEVQLVKLNEDPSKYMGFKLADIYLNNKGNFEIYQEGSSSTTLRMNNDDYMITNNIRYSFNNVPVLENGEYAIAVGIKNSEEYFIPINCFYFKVE